MPTKVSKRNLPSRNAAFLATKDHDPSSMRQKYKSAFKVKTCFKEEVCKVDQQFRLLLFKVSYITIYNQNASARLAEKENYESKNAREI